MNKKRRIFIACFPGWSVKKKIISWHKENAVVPGRPVLELNLHVTLIPPWYEEDVPKIISLLSSVKKTGNKIYVVFENISLGPAKNPRLVWMTGSMPPSLLELISLLEEKLNRKPSSRKPLLHVTLHRFSKKDKLPESIKNNILWKDNLSSFFLVESFLKKTGAVYEKIAEIKF